MEREQESQFRSQPRVTIDDVQKVRSGGSAAWMTGCDFCHPAKGLSAAAGVRRLLCGLMKLAPGKILDISEKVRSTTQLSLVPRTLLITSPYIHHPHANTPSKTLLQVHMLIERCLSRAMGRAEIIAALTRLGVHPRFTALGEPRSRRLCFWPKGWGSCRHSSLQAQRPPRNTQGQLPAAGASLLATPVQTPAPACPASTKTFPAQCTTGSRRRTQPSLPPTKPRQRITSRCATGCVGGVGSSGRAWPGDQQAWVV